MSILRVLVAGVAAALFGAGCVTEGTEASGGANANDRSTGGEQGAILGMNGPEMLVSPHGRFVVRAGRGGGPTIDDLETGISRALPFAGDRFLFSPTRDVVYVVKPRRAGIAAVDLVTGAELWSNTPAFSTTLGSFLAKVTSDDRTLLVGDYERVFVVDTQTGKVRGVSHVGEAPVDLEVLPGGRAAISVGSTRWDSIGPHTPVSLFDFEGRVSVTIDVPNCAAPIVVLPEGNRALLSPTFCEAGKGPTAGSLPDVRPPPKDPVSVIDIDVARGALSFVKNLPGFGPVALLADGRAVAYVDRDRVEPPMFDDPSQIPPKDGPKHYLMTIDPRALRFDLHAIGESLPRFVASKDGRSLLVDATVSLVRDAEAKITFSPRGITAEVSTETFGQAVPVGVFDLVSRSYAPFTGPKTTLDRFVQQDGGRVVALADDNRLRALDPATRTAEDLGMSALDVGLLPDGKTLVLWTEAGLCLSADGKVCSRTIAAKPE